MSGFRPPEPIIGIEIDLDKRCTLCGKPGATPRGWCLKCVVNRRPQLLAEIDRKKKAHRA